MELAWIITCAALLLLVITRHSLYRTRRQLTLQLIRELCARPHRSDGVTGLDIIRASDEVLPRGVIHVILGNLVDEGLIVYERDPADGRYFYLPVVREQRAVVGSRKPG